MAPRRLVLTSCQCQRMFPILIMLISFMNVNAMENPYNRKVNLDKTGNFTLEWEVNFESKIVVFNATVATVGFMGLGFSKRGTKSSSDFVISGVATVPYLLDMHVSSENENTLVEDISNDYTLQSAWKNGSHTTVQFSRSFETCDGHDYSIGNNTVVLLWCYGETHDYSQCLHQNRGIYRTHLLDPNFAPKEFQRAGEERRVANSSELTSQNLKVWTVSRKQLVPATETVYWCSMHKGPQLERRHHLVGFNFRWEHEVEYNRTHHMVLLRCQAPEGRDPQEFFDPFLRNDTGEMCFFFLRGENGGLPLQYCRETVYAYAIGARIFFLPNHTGIPFGDSPHEYYALQVHYDNYDRRADLEYTINIDLYYTNVLREHEAGIATTGHNIPGSPSILIPPDSKEHTIYGYCGCECTRKMLPVDGIHILAVEQHTHLSGRRHRLQHFRNGKELPFIVNDSDYDGNFQAVRMLQREVHVQPGDLLVTRCVFDNTWTNGSVVGGFTTRQEMCLEYIWYYNKLLNHSVCRSEISANQGYTQKYLGVKNFTWSNEYLEFVVTEPEKLAGMTISQVADDHIEWSSAKRQELQRDQRFLPQWNMCPSMKQLREGHGDEDGSVVNFPTDVKNYVPEASLCS